MNYIEKTFNEIFEAMLQDSLSKGLISHAEEFESYIKNQDDISNYYVMDKAVIAQMIVKVYQDITRAYEAHKVEYATGTDLDDIGSIIGITRPEASHAECQVTFILNDTLEEDIDEPAGIIISTNSGIEYKTLEQLFIPAGKDETTVSCQAVASGVKGKVIENTLTTIVTETSHDLRCTNYQSSTGGNEAYTDDEYRYLLMNWTKILLKGSNEAYEYYFSDFNGIDGYKIVPNWNGTGTVKVVLDPGTSYQLNKAYNDLQNIISQNTEDITMFPPTPKPIDIFATVDVDIDQINPYSAVEKEDIKARVISAIRVFIDGGYRTSTKKYYPGLLLGEDFIPHKLAVFLDKEIPELKNITFTYPEDYIQILDDEVGVSNKITIEMI